MLSDTVYSSEAIADSESPILTSLVSCSKLNPVVFLRIMSIYGLEDFAAAGRVVDFPPPPVEEDFPAAFIDVVVVVFTGVVIDCVIDGLVPSIT